MDYERRPIVAPPPGNVHGHYSVPPNSGGEQNRQYGHQPIGRSNYAQDDAALNLDSVFVNSRSLPYQQQQFGVGNVGITPSQQQYPTGTLHPGSSSFNNNRSGHELDFHRNRQVNLEAKDDYYDPMYPTVSTPTGDFGSGLQFFGDKSYTKNDGHGVIYSSNERRPGPRQIQLPSASGSSKSFQNNVLTQPRQLPTTLQFQPSRSQEEMTSQIKLGLGQDSHLQPSGGNERPSNMFLRTSQASGGPLGPLRLGGYATDENLQRAIRAFPNSELNAIARSLNTDVIKSSSEREVVPKPNYLTVPTPDGRGNSIFSKNAYLDTSYTTSLRTPGAETVKSIYASIVNKNEGGIPRLRVFTDVVTIICDDYGFVGPEVFFQTSVVSGTNKPQVGDRVLVEAEFVEGMQFKWNCTKVEVINRSSQQGNIANSNENESRPLSPSHYFRDVLTARHNTASISAFTNEAQKPCRNPPPPPNISRTYAHSSSRRSRSRSRSSGRNGRNYRRDSHDYVRGHSSPRNSRRRSGSRSWTPENYRRQSNARELSAERERQRKLTDERNRLSFEELVFSDRRKQEIPQKKTFTNVPSDLSPADVFKVTTISKKVTPSISILPLKSSLSSRVKSNPKAIVPIQTVNKSKDLKAPRTNAKGIKTVAAPKRSTNGKTSTQQTLKGYGVSVPISGAQKAYLSEKYGPIVAEDKERGGVSASTAVKPSNKGGEGSDQAKVTQGQNTPNMNSGMVLRNPAYRGNALPNDKIGISIRLGFMEAKKQHKEKHSHSQDEVDTSNDVKKPATVAPMAGNSNVDKIKCQNTDSKCHSTNRTAAPVTEGNFQTKGDERRSVSKATMPTEGRSENTQIRDHEVVIANRDERTNVGKRDSNTKKKAVENNPRRKPIAKGDKERANKIRDEIREKYRTNKIRDEIREKDRANKIRDEIREKDRANKIRDEIREKDLKRTAYRERVKRIQSKKEELERRRSEIRKDRDRASGHVSRHGNRHRTNRSPVPKTRMEPIVQMVPLVEEEMHFGNHGFDDFEEYPGYEPVQEEFVSVEEVIIRERELEERERQLNEEQFYLETQMAELDAVHKLKLESETHEPQPYYYDEGRDRSRSPGYYDSLHSGPIVFGSSAHEIYPERRQRTLSPSPSSRGDRVHSRPPSPSHHRRHLSHSRRSRRSGSNQFHDYPGKRSLTPPHIHHSYPRERSPEIAYFRIDRRSPGRITPENRDNFYIRGPGPSGNQNQMPWSGNSEFSQFSDGGRYINDFDYDLYERRRRADEELMSEELGEEERRIFRGDFDPPPDIPFVAFPASFPIPIEMQMQASYDCANRFVWAPEENLQRPGPGGSRKKPKVPKPICTVCGKRGHTESNCWQLPPKPNN